MLGPVSPRGPLQCQPVAPPQSTPPPGPGECQRSCHGRRLFAGARGGAAATDGAGGGGPPPPGRPPRAAPSAPQPAPRAHASPPRAPPAAKFGSTLRRALTPCPFHPLTRSSAAAASQAAARAQPRSPARRRAATATAAGGRGATAWGRRPAPASGRRRGPAPRRAPRGPRGRPEPGARLLEAAGRRSPPRAPRPPRSNRNCSSIDWAPLGERPVRVPRASACGRQKGRKSDLCSEGGGTAQGTSLPHLCVCRPSPSSPQDFRSVSELRSPRVRHGRAGCVNNMIIH